MTRRLLGGARDALQARKKERERLERKALRREEVREQYRAWYPVEAPGPDRLNVLLVVQSRRKPTSSTYIRMLSPLTHPALGRPVGIDLVDEGSFHLSSDIDVCIVQRTAFSDVAAARRVVDEVRAQGVALVVESDDAFNALEADHPQHDAVQERAEALGLLMQEADEVWTSTPELARAQHLERPPVVVPNSLDLRVWALEDGPERDVPLEDPLQILYMGTATHDGDFQMVLPVLDRLHETHPGEFVVTTIGVSKDLPERTWLQPLKPEATAYPSFVAWLSSAGPFDIGLSPLVDTPFNRCKSDIKCLDYLAIGARPVVSDVLCYAAADLDGLVDRVPNTPEAWFARLESQVAGRTEDRRTARGRRSAGHEYVRDHREVATTAARLGELLTRLTDRA